MQHQLHGERMKGFFFPVTESDGSTEERSGVCTLVRSLFVSHSQLRRVKSSFMTSLGLALQQQSS